MNDKKIQVILTATDKLTQPLNAVGTKINKIGKGITSTFKNIGMISGGIIGGLGGALTLEFDKAFNQLQVQTGLTGDAFKDLKTTSLDLFAKGFGQDIQTSIKAVSILNRELDLTGEELKEVSKGALLIADNFNKDINEVVRATTGLMKTYGITGQEANDMLLKALQETGDGYDDLLDTVNEYSLGISQSGLAYKDFVNILISGTKLGLRNTDELGEMLRENVIRITDGSKKTRNAFKSIGLSYEKDYIEKVKNGNGDISGLIKEVSKRIGGLQDPLLQVTAGVDLYGTKFEDNGVKVIGAISNMGNHLGDFNGLVEDSGEIVEKSLGSSWKQLKVTLVETLDPLKENVEGVSSWMRENEALTASITKIVVIVGAIAAGLAIVGSIISGIGSLISGVGAVFSFILPILGAIGAALTSTAGIMVAIGAAAFAIGYAIGFVLHKSFNFVVEKAKMLWQWIKDIGSAIKEFFTFGEDDQTVKLEKNITSSLNPGTVGNLRNNGNGETKVITQTNDIKIEVNGNNMNSEEVSNEVIRKLNDQDQLLKRGVV